MIQRKQTIYLLLALLALVVCLSLPIGQIEPKGMGIPMVWYNYGLLNDRSVIARPLPFIDLVITGILSLTAIFLYKRRPLQAMLCTISYLLLVAWYAYYFIVLYLDFQDHGTWGFRFAACLPLVAIILLVMAKRGIKADERLVKSMDRIR